MNKTKRGCQLGCQQGVRGYQLKAIDTLMTPYLTPMKKQNNIRYLKIKANYECFNKFLTIFLNDLTPIKLTPSKQAINIPVNKIQNFINFVKKMDVSNDKKGASFNDLIDKGFEDDFINKRIHEGVVFEHKPGFLKVLE